MWLLSKNGFYSIVQKPWDRKSKTLTVRSRVWKDLKSMKYIANREGITFIEDDKADYRYRFQAPKTAVAQAVAQLVKEIDYDNFKNKVGSKDYDRAAIYGEVWQLLTQLEQLEDDRELGYLDEESLQEWLKQWRD